MIEITLWSIISFLVSSKAILRDTRPSVFVMCRFPLAAGYINEYLMHQINAVLSPWAILSWLFGSHYTETLNRVCRLIMHLLVGCLFIILL